MPVEKNHNFAPIGKSCHPTTCLLSRRPPPHPQEHNVPHDGDAALRALEVFIKGFCLSMPTGKQNTFANRTLPEAVVVSVRDDQPVSLVGAFEKPIRTNEADGYLTRSVGALAEHARAIEDNYGLRPLAGFVVALKGGDILAPEGPDAPAPLGERVSFTELPGRVLEVVSPRVGREERA